MPQFKFPCLKLKQRDSAQSPAAILFAAPAGDVLQWAAIQRRSETQEGTQRKLSKAKVGAIKRFLLGDSRNTIPSALVLTLNVADDAFTDVVLPLPDDHPMKHWVKVVSIDVSENVPDSEKPGIVLDGQHRLLGMAAFSPMCMVNVVALLNVDDMEKAFQFLVINNKAAKISGDLIRTLGLDYQEEELSSRLRTARVSLHDNLRFIGIIDSDEESPFRGIIAIVDTTDQAQRFVPPSAIESSIAIIQQQKVRELDEDDALCDFFYSIWGPIKQQWHELWNRESRLLSKVGVMCMTSYMAEALISRFDFGENLDVNDPDQLRAVVGQFLKHQTPEFWRSDWKPGSYDTKAGRETVIRALTQISRNLRADEPWYEDIDMINR